MFEGECKFGKSKSLCLLLCVFALVRLMDEQY